MKSKQKQVSKCCGADVILVDESGTLEALGYGYGTIVCCGCGERSSYYGEGTISEPCEAEEAEDDSD